MSRLSCIFDFVEFGKNNINGIKFYIKNNVKVRNKPEHIFPIDVKKL